MKRKFVDYNLSDIKDTKGGFLVDTSTTIDDISASNKHSKSNNTNIIKPPLVVYEHLLPSQQCLECSSFNNINSQYFTIYKIAVCNPCIDTYPDKYSLLTKTECRTDYLLTNEELEALAYMERQNPLKPTYSRMKLYLRCQAENFAINKWGSLDDLDKEYERRCAVKEKKKSQKFRYSSNHEYPFDVHVSNILIVHRQKLSELRKRTMTAALQTEVSTKHQHVFETTLEGIQKCKDCGLAVEVEEF